MEGSAKNRDAVPLLEVPLQLPDEEELLPLAVRQVGYPSLDVVGAEILAEIRRAVREGLACTCPAGTARVAPLLCWTSREIRAEALRVESPRWARVTERLVGPELLGAFLITLGPEVDAAIARQQERSLFHAYLLDGVGSALAELLAGQAEARLAERAAERGLALTGRFSPGYCDWDIRSGQDALFDFLEPERLGVRRTAGGMMLPRKSVSACVVAAREVPTPVPCVFCPKGDCLYRRMERASGAEGEQPA